MAAQNSARPAGNGGPAASIPTESLRLWLRADAGVHTNGARVTRWTDQSGSGNDAKQSLSANQPVSVLNAINGKPVVRFDGISDFMSFNLPVNGSTAMTVVLVSATTQDVASNNEGSPAPLYWDQTAAWGMLYVNPLQRSLQWRFGTGQYLNLPTYTRPASIGNNYSLTTVVKNGTMETAYVNGSLVLTQTGKLTTIANVTDAAYLGHDLYSNTYFPGDLAEVLVYTRALSDTERQQVEQYLFAKYLLGWAPQPVNQAPIVSAGPNQTITLPASATLSGTATDDGLPNGILTTTWSKVSGPGTVTFGNASALSTTASFSAAGTYVLRLTASDSALSSSSDVTITVNSSSSGGSSTPPPGAVVINPGDNIQSLVNSHPAGSVYYLNAGVYRLQTITPHSGDTFIGTLDASGNRLSILNGAKIIPSSNFVPSGSQWVAAGETQVIPPDPNTAASCMGDSPRCLYAEELFLDGVRLHQVASISAVVPRTWFYDSAAAKAYIGQDPTGHTIERSITARAFNSVANVTVKNLVVEKYANYSTSGAISSVAIAGWNIQNNEIRNNHGAGAFVGPGSKLLNNFVHHNGQIGFLGNGASVTNSPILEEGNEISFNNDAGYRYDWEAGGTKFLRTYYLVVRNNYSHDNRGLGLWTDYGNYYTTYESNRSARDKEVGISHELSFDATVRYNVVENMLQSEFYQNSMWNNCGIGNVHSRRVTVYGNAVLNNVNGICGLMDARPNNSEYPEGFAVSDFNVHDNAVVQLMNFAGGITVASGATTNPYDPSQNNRWTNNIYKLDSNTAPRYLWGGCGACTTNQWKPIPQDAIGTWINPADATFASITFNAGDRLQATATTQVRSLPSATDGILVGTQSVGATGTVTIVRGPIYTGGAWWWQVHYDNGITGWSPGGTLQKSP